MPVINDHVRNLSAVSGLRTVANAELYARNETVAEGADVIEIEAWMAGAGGLLVTVAGTVKLGGLLRLWLRHRTRVALERERSAREAARLAGLARLARQPRATLRLVETDGDGQRLVEIGRADAATEGEAA
jgi:hypothetical protein